MSAPKRSTEVRQAEIAQAALGIIASKGMKGLSVAAVARKVGIVPSGIYRHYRNKTAMLDAILDFIRERFDANVQTVPGMDADAMTRLQSLLTRHIRLIRDNEAIPAVVFSAEVCTQSPRRRAKLMGIIESYLKDIAAMVTQGQKEGTIRTELAPATVAMLFLGLIQPSAFVWHLSGGKYDVAAHSEAAWPVFCRAIQTDASGRTGGHANGQRPLGSHAV